MEINYTEEKKDQMIAQHSRLFYKNHMQARVLRRTLPKGNPTRDAGERSEQIALNNLISTIEAVDGKDGAQP